MKLLQITSISTITASLVLLAGCSSTPATNTNAAVNTNVANTNVVVNENTNTEVSSDVDTSDWLTYMNDEYGFSFKYPSEWGGTVITTRGPGDYQTGSVIQIAFDNDSSRNGNQLTAVIKVETLDYKFNGPSDGNTISFASLDLTQSEADVNNALKNDTTADIITTKVTTANNIQGVRLDENVVSLGGENELYIEYLLPKFNSNQNIRIYGEKEIDQILEVMVNTLTI